MNSELVSFIRKYYVDDLFHSHQTLFEPLGKYRFGREILEKFEDLYLKLAQDPHNNILGIAEKPREQIPIYADFDIKIKLTDDFTFSDSLYTEKNILDVVKIFNSVIRQVLDNCNEKHLYCALMEKPISKMTRIVDGKETVYYKHGFHIHYYNIFLKKSDIAIQVYPRIRKMLKELDVFANLGAKDSSEIMDYKVIDNAWLMYGGRKDPHKDPYLLTKVFDANCEEISLDKAFDRYQIYDTNEVSITITPENWKYYLPCIFSIIPHHRQINDLKPNLISPLREEVINNAVKNGGRSNPKKQLKVSVQENIKTAKRLVPLLSQYRSDNFHDWIEIGWVLFNISEGSEDGLEIWKEFSERCEEKYDEDGCHLYWSKMVKKEYTVATLKYYASIDSPDEYSKYKYEEGQKCIKDSIQGSHFDIAKLLFNEYCTEYVCASIASKQWFRYVDHRWEEIEDGVFLRQHVSTDIVEKFTKYGSTLFQQQGTCDKAEDKAYSERIKQTQKTISNLKSAPFKANVMKEAADLFYDKNFLRKLDMNAFLIGFKNGVYDLKKKEFRSGKPEDYISKQMPISYIDFDESDERVEQVYDFLEKVFPDKSVRKYFLDQASDVFQGGNDEKVVNFWTGDGDNAKSITQQLMEEMLGPYAIKFSTTLLTGKKLSNGVANPELARAGGGVRWAVLEEPDNDEELNIGYLKSLSGDDSLFVRDLFEKGKATKEIKPMFKLIFICNKNPRIKNADQATFNRIRVIPFESKFVRQGEPIPSSYEEQLRQKRFPRDNRFKQKIPELLEPLAWVLLKHRKSIIGTRVVPEKVMAATLVYQKQNDRLRQFIEERVKEKADSFLHVDELYNEFRTWYRDSFSSGVPDKNEIKEYFIKKWGELDCNFRWRGYKIKDMSDVSGEEVANTDWFSNETKEETKVETKEEYFDDEEEFDYNEEEVINIVKNKNVVINNGMTPIM